MAPNVWTRIAALAAAALCALASGCGGSGDTAPIRIGVLTECLGPFEGTREAVIGAVESPLIRRGATPAGAVPSQGLRGARIAGHPVEVVSGCSTFGEYSWLVEETRRLVETGRVDVVIGPVATTDGTVFRRIAARYPGVTFVLGWSGASSVTLRDPSPNVFRVGPTAAQSIAGLATYAYQDLHWRTAAIIADDYSPAWEYDAAFTAEFCALGGRVISHDYASMFTFPPDPEAVRRAQSADGVALLSVAGTVGQPATDPFMTAYARGRRDLSRHVVLAGPTFRIPAKLDWHVDATGIVVSQDYPVRPNAEGKALATTLATAFPGLLSRDPIVDEFVGVYAEAADAIVQALDAAHGDLGDGQSRFRAALSSLPVDSPRGPVRLDANRQGIVTTYLTQVERRKGPPTLHDLRAIPGVDETLGGLITAVPQRAPIACVRKPPPPWSR